jgi:transposase
MDFKRIITQLLGLQDVNIEDIKLFKKDLRAEIKARQVPKKCVCCSCGGKLYGIHQWQQRKMTAPPMGVFQSVIIRLYYLRAACDRCLAIRTAKIPFMHPKFEAMTCGFAEVAGRLMEEITCEATGRLLNYDSKALWSLDQWRMKYMLQFMQLPNDLDVSLLSADEVHFKTKRFKNRKGWTAKRWEAEFVTNLVCYNNSKVIFNAMGRDSKSLRDCLSVLSQGQKLAVEFFALDMHDPFIRVAKEACPNAEISIDRFHLAEQINKKFDEVRKTELRKAQSNKDLFQEGMLAPSRRFVLVERAKNLTKQESKMLDQLRGLNKNIHNAMLLVEYFHTVLDKKKISSFRKSLTNWYLLVRESQLAPFKKIALLIRKYRLNIEAYIKSNLTTAVSEGLNNKIKVLKRMAYGFNNPISFRNKILQRCGFLNSNYINTQHFYWHVAQPR